ncbi:MAG: VCBS repeat-containing protein, partial [Myxococcales bacterium]|nr:VCBS repeat-containing protein [Myxococcales bacterium]
MACTVRRSLPVLALSVALAACGDDDSDSVTDAGSGTQTSSGSTSPSTTDGTASDSDSDGTTAGTMGSTTSSGTDPTDETTDGETTEGTTDETTDETTDATTVEPTDSDSDSDPTTTTTGDPPDECKVPQDELDAMTECDMEAPPDSFTPDVQWTWSDPVDRWSIVTPLVANLTDDNDDGEIDLCDIPDVVVLAYPQTSAPGFLYVLDGATGALHFKIEEPVHWGCSPALGDIDDDGLPEIIAYRAGSILAFEHDGTKKWEQPTTVAGLAHAIALADVDNDGDVEILLGNSLYDHNGALIVAVGGVSALSASVLADLDGDDDME